MMNGLRIFVDFRNASFVQVRNQGYQGPTAYSRHPPSGLGKWKCAPMTQDLNSVPMSETPSRLGREPARTPLPQMGLSIRGGLTPRTLRRVREHVAAHLESTISLEDLASIAGMATHHFARAFKQSEGVSPRSYLLHCRVQRARYFLACTDMPISEIAVACGFSDQSQCTRRFKEYVGVTPSHYRSSIR